MWNFLCVCAAELWQFQPRSQPVLSLRRVDMCRWTQAPWSLSPTSSASPTVSSSRGSGFCAPPPPPALRTKRIEACSASSASACLPGRWRLLRRFAGRRPHRPRHLGHLVGRTVHCPSCDARQSIKLDRSKESSHTPGWSARPRLVTSPVQDCAILLTESSHKPRSGLLRPLNRLEWQHHSPSTPLQPSTAARAVSSDVWP